MTKAIRVERCEAAYVGVLAAKEVGLRYVLDGGKGFTRKCEGTTFIYLDVQQMELKEPRVLERIKGLKIPPAWQQVWISPLEQGHLQATGIDAKGRKQYIYHPKWSQMRCENKFDKMYEFGSFLPKIRAAVAKDLRLKKLNKDKVLATVVGLLDHTLIRIGNKAYEKANKSFGLTTLKDRHVKALGAGVVFEFVGKKGVKQHIRITDAKLSKMVKKCKDIPGYPLFQYYDAKGGRQVIRSEDVNSYLKEVTGHEITAKDFRTWGASVFAMKLLQETECPATDKEVKACVQKVVKSVAEKLGNTPAVCRKHYLHPLVLNAYTDEGFMRLMRKNHKQGRSYEGSLHGEEKLFMKLLKDLRH